MQNQPQTQSQTPQLQKSHKNKYQFNLERNRKILIQSDFDNGNISLLKQVSELQYRLEAVSDYKSTTPKKTWFYFRVSGPKAIRIRLIIENVSIYENMYEDKDWARPVMNDGTGWRDVKQAFLTYRGEVGIAIDYTFASESFVYFALTVPHSYQDSENYLKQLAYKMPQHIQYEDEIIGKSWGGLNLHLLRFTAKQQNGHRQKQGNSSSSHLISFESHLNQKKSNPRIHSQASIDKYLGNASHIKKPIILVTSRVHPGEVGSTHCLMGIIDFITRASNLQAYLLLRMFQIMVIPIVNPDGVFDGNYRMDLNNVNLNRVYQEPDPELHPTVYRIKELVSSMINPNIGNPNWPKEKADRLLSIISRKIMFHFDLHSHSCNKPAFIYGNAFDQIVTQTQSELYCKILQENCQMFRYGLSHFGQKHMKMKDKGEPLTKQGCARVVISKMANIIYSYTVQTAIFPYLTKQQINPALNQQFKFSQQLGFEDITTEQLSIKYSTKNQLFIDNMLLGHSLMTTILDILEKNPYTRYPNIQQSLDLYRKQISQGLLQGQERFKLLDIKAYQKVRNITKFCKEEITNKNQKFWDYLANDKSICSVKWPANFKMFEHCVPNLGDIQLLRRKNRTKTEVSESQRQINDFINPKNVRKRYLNMQIDTLGQTEIQSKAKNEISPTKSLVSPKNIQIELDIHSNQNGNGPSLPEIRSSIQRTPVNQKNRGNSNSLTKHQAIGLSIEEIEQKKQAQLELKQIRQLKELQKKQSTKNIVLSFIHQQMQKMNTMRKNVQKSMAVQNRLASYKLIKKSSRSSSKVINQLGTVSMSANRYGIILNTNTVHTQNQNQNSNINNNVEIDNSHSLTAVKSKKKLGVMQTCQQIISRRKNNVAVKQDEQQQQYEEEEGIYYVDQSKEKLEEPQEQLGFPDSKIVGHKMKISKLPSSLQKISQYPVYAHQKQKDTSAVVINSKRELAKVKYSEIKKKNIIRQDLSSNNNFKLPELRGIHTNANGNSNNGKSTSQHQGSERVEDGNIKSNRNGVSINVNLNVNLNLCIDREFQGRARAATMPDQC